MSIDVMLGSLCLEILVPKNVLRQRCAVKLVRRSKDAAERRAPMPFR
jgi:hypothetical protein